MAWSESKAWKRGSAHQKLYQSLLECLKGTVGEPA
jgi:hypothetical protein